MKMRSQLHFFVLLLSVVSILCKEPELPLCPTNLLQYFPQNLPMHCRMPANSNFPNPPDTAQFPTMPPFYQSPPPDKDPPIPIPIPPPPGGMPMMPGAPMMPMPMPMPMPMAPSPHQKLPVIVMPFYSPDPNFRKPQMPLPRPRPRRRPRPRPRHKYDVYKRPSLHSDSESSDTDMSSDDSHDIRYSSSGKSSERGFWKGKKRNYRRSSVRRSDKKHNHKSKKEKKDILTPILQYVTKDGYVIYEKTISKDEAKNWLATKKTDDNIEVSKHVDHSTVEEDINASVDMRKEEIVPRHEGQHEMVEHSPEKAVPKPHVKPKYRKKHAIIPKQMIPSKVARTSTLD